MSPKFCEGCKQLDPNGYCGGYQTCAKWRAWFREEWQAIRKAAGLVIERREYKQDKLDELRQELREEYKKERSEGT